jgi:hypothetical protein
MSQRLTGPPIRNPAQGMDPECVAGKPYSGSPAISTSAIRLLVVASHSGNSMPAALRIRLRPPSHPTRQSARSDRPSDGSTSTPVSSRAPRGWAGREVADVQRDPAEPDPDLPHVALRQASIVDAMLIEYLDRAREAARPSVADEVLAGAPPHKGDGDACSHQLAGQHHAGRTSAGHHHGMLGHRDARVGSTLLASCASGTRTRATPSTTSARDNNVCIFLVPPFPQVLRLGGELCDITWGLRQGDLGGVDLMWRGRLAESAPR